MHTRFSKISYIFIVLLLCVVHASGQRDSLKLNFPQAEIIFLQKNFELLAQQYNVDINKALVQQNRYWDNPVLNTDQNIYDGKFFRHDSQYGQVFVQIQQLIKTAGKRNKLIRLSKDNVLSAQQQFYDVMRNLRFLLHNDLSTLQQLFQTNKIYQAELGSLQALVQGMDAQLQAGNISQRENIRIKSLLFALQADQADLQRQVTDIEKELHTMLRTGNDTVIVPQLDSVSGQVALLPSFTLPQLWDTAAINRPDVQLAQTNFISQQHNLSYQKSLAVPDLTAGVEFDQRSSYAPNYYGLALSIPIPLLNKNKGNIHAARISIMQAENGIMQIQQQVKDEVTAAWQKLKISSDLQKLVTPAFTGKYEELMQNILRSYQLHQVGLVEFIDFFDAYKEARIKQFQLETDLRNAIAELNFTTGSNIIAQ